MASMSTGEVVSRAMRLASFVALYTASVSPPSTRIVDIPYDGPRPAIPSPENSFCDIYVYVVYQYLYIFY